MNRALVALMLVVALLSISSASILVILSRAEPEACAFWRVLIAGLLLGASYPVARMSPRAGVGRWVALSVLSGAFLSAHFITWMRSLFMVPVAVSTTVVVTYPLISAIPDSLVFRERVTALQLASLATSLAGVALFTQPAVLGGYDIRGVTLAFTGSVFASMYFTLGKYVRRGLGLVEYTATAYLSAALVTLLFSALSGVNVASYPPTTYAFFIALAAVPMIGGHTVMNYLIKYLKVSVTTAIALGEPVGASILAYLVLGQSLTPQQVGAMAVTLSGLALLYTAELKGVKP